MAVRRVSVGDTASRMRTATGDQRLPQPVGPRSPRADRSTDAQPVRRSVPGAAWRLVPSMAAIWVHVCPCTRASATASANSTWLLATARTASPMRRKRLGADGFGCRQRQFTVTGDTCPPLVQRVPTRWCVGRLRAGVRNLRAEGAARDHAAGSRDGAQLRHRRDGSSLGEGRQQGVVVLLGDAQRRLRRLLDLDLAVEQTGLVELP